MNTKRGRKLATKIYRTCMRKTSARSSFVHLDKDTSEIFKSPTYLRKEG